MFFCILGKSISKLHKDCHQWIIHYDTKPTESFWMLVSSWRVADFQLVSFSNRQNACQNILRQRCRSHFLSTTNAMFTVWEGGKLDWFHQFGGCSCLLYGVFSIPWKQALND